MLFTTLQPFFKENGFQIDTAAGIFRRIHPEGWLTVALVESRHPAGGVLAELRLGIRHTLVEEIVYPFELGMRPMQEEAHTLLVNQHQIEDKVPQNEWLRDEADAMLVAHQWQQWMLEKGFAWLDIHRQAVWLDQVYNDDPETVRRWLPAAFPRSLRAVALAYLCQRLDFRSVLQRGKRDLAEAGAAPELLLRLDGLVGALP